MIPAPPWTYPHSPEQVTRLDLHPNCKMRKKQLFHIRSLWGWSKDDVQNAEHCVMPCYCAVKWGRYGRDTGICMYEGSLWEDLQTWVTVIATLGDGDCDGKEGKISSIMFLTFEPHTHTCYLLIFTTTTSKSNVQCVSFCREQLSMVIVITTAVSLTPELPSQSALLKKLRPWEKPWNLAQAFKIQDSPWLFQNCQGTAQI